MKRILIPLDGSLIAEQVLPYAQRLATMLGGGVKLLKVVDDSDNPPSMREELIAGMSRGVVHVAYSENVTASSFVQRKQAHTYLANQAQRYFSAMDVDTIVHVGSPAEAIVDVAERHEVAMIAMATHGYSGLRRRTLGNTADKVIHAATVPVLIIRAAMEPNISAPALRRILVPLDGSPLARQALPHACQLAGQAHGELLLLTITAPQHRSGHEIMVPEQQASGLQDEARTLRATLSEQLLNEVAPFMEGQGEPKLAVTPLVAHGSNVAEAIIEAAERNHADLVVMATHGYSGLRRWALGSVADSVLHACQKPLLLVRAREAART
jgi:nucleotide-binding universal stress UspA family protein